MELLVAILIMGMASGMMAIMISTSVNLNTQAKNSDQVFYKEMNEVEIKTRNLSIINQKITLTHGTESAEFELDIYGEDKEKPIFAFAEK